MDCRNGRSLSWETGVRFGSGIAPSGEPYPGLLRLLREQVEDAAADLRMFADCPDALWSVVRGLYGTPGQRDYALELVRELLLADSPTYRRLGG